MATSGTYTFTVTRDDVITQAMQNIGKLGAGEPMSAEDVTDCARQLNLLVKQWMGRTDFSPGLKMWTRQRADLFLSSTQYAYALGPSGDNWAAGVYGSDGNYHEWQQISNKAAAATSFTYLFADNSKWSTGDYIVFQLDNGDTYSTTVASVDLLNFIFTIPAPGLPSAASTGNYVWNFTTKGQRPLELVTALLRQSDGTDTPLDFMTLQTYEALPTKTASGYVGDPSAVYYEAQLTNGMLYLDVAGAQDVTKHIHVVYLRPVQDFSAATDNPEYPAEWFLPLCWGLARQIAPMYNAPWTQAMQNLYDESLAIARESTPETTEIYFQPG